MVGRSKIVDESELGRWFREGRTYRWMVQEYARKYNLEVGISMFSNFRRRHGLAMRLVRDYHLIPWSVRPEHESQGFLAYLRKLARRRAGEELSEEDNKRVNNFLAKLEAEDLVVYYDPDTEEGFFLVPREPQDVDYVRQPPREHRRHVPKEGASQSPDPLC